METRGKNSGVSDAPDRRGEGSVPALPMSSSSEILPDVSTADTLSEAATAMVRAACVTEVKVARPGTPISVRSESPISVGGEDLATWAESKGGCAVGLEELIESIGRSRCAILGDLDTAEAIRRNCRDVGGRA